jgi:hypothetical protein
MLVYIEGLMVNIEDSRIEVCDYKKLEREINFDGETYSFAGIDANYELILFKEVKEDYYVGILVEQFNVVDASLLNSNSNSVILEVANFYLNCF